MPTFLYQARNSHGELVENQVEASSSEALASSLINEGMTPVDIKEALIDIPETPFSLFNNKSVSLQDMIMFSRQMYSLLKAGVPITQAMANLAENAHSDSLKETLLQVLSDLKGGTSMAAALSSHHKVFSQLYISMIHVGENTGRLDLAFKQMAAYLEFDLNTKQKISEALRYPSFVIIGMGAAITIINIFVIPAFSGIFATFNAELPLITRILIGFSNFCLEWGWFLLASLIGAVIGFRYWISTPEGHYLWDGFKIKIPLVGPIVYRALLSRFARSFAMCHRSGVPISSALAIVSNAVDNKSVGNSVKRMREAVERGEGISRAATNENVFSPLLLQMLSVGEETGQLDELLNEIADFYEREVDYDLSKLSQNIEPILIVLMGGLVLLLALGVFLPMWELSAVART